MGFSDREIVALSGAHCLGRCHTDRSGYKGPWTFSPTSFTNDYFKLLLSEKWSKKKWNGMIGNMRWRCCGCMLRRRRFASPLLLLRGTLTHSLTHHHHHHHHHHRFSSVAP